mmetsp:Transcript_16149/g.44989  ORF Transcript_16149/g.44989 Transcript_16149/m.44989 type:complete len:444 (+) Transcript_16149:225-1556(+)
MPLGALAFKGRSALPSLLSPYRSSPVRAHSSTNHKATTPAGRLSAPPPSQAAWALSGFTRQLATRRSSMAEPQAENGSTLDGQAPESTDFANYFCTYGFIYHQKDMLEDHKRTGAYFNAVMQNKKQFEGKVVLDVGTGSGILAVFAAKAGAKKVYAVEATDMAKFARSVVETNGLSDVVTVIQGMVETVKLPEKVDIIISEWMGYFLLRESMLDSVLLARDRFLKPGGSLYPSHAHMYYAPIRTNTSERRRDEFHGSKEGWEEFNTDMKTLYGVDLGCLTEAYHKEQRDYYIDSSAWQDVHPSQVVGQPMCFKSYDLNKVTIEEIATTIKAHCSLPIMEPGHVDAFCAWFDVEFCGSEENPADEQVLLTTAPDATGATHWGQQTFFLNPPLECGAGDSIRMTIEINRKKENHRLMSVLVKYKLQGTSQAAKMATEVSRHFHIE